MNERAQRILPDYLIEIMAAAELRSKGKVFPNMPTVSEDRRKAINRFSATEREVSATRTSDPLFGALHAQQPARYPPEFDFPDDVTLMSTTDAEQHHHVRQHDVRAGERLHERGTRRPAAQRGAPPDMPREAFADMWATLRRGEPWTALVKNRRKNGDHYCACERDSGDAKRRAARLHVGADKGAARRVRGRRRCIARSAKARPASAGSTRGW